MEDEQSLVQCASCNFAYLIDTDESEENTRCPKCMVQVPAIAGIVVSIIQGLLIFWVVINIIVDLIIKPKNSQPRVNYDMPMPPDGYTVPITFVVTTCFFLSVQALIFHGCFCLLKLRNRGMVMAAMILLLTPCVSPGILLGIPYGILGLLVLSDPRVIKAFNANAS